MCRRFKKLENNIYMIYVETEYLCVNQILKYNEICRINIISRIPFKQ